VSPSSRFIDTVRKPARQAEFGVPAFWGPARRDASVPAAYHILMVKKTDRATVRVYRLGDEPGDDLSTTTTPAERVLMVWALTVEAWTVAGLPLEAIPRANMPVQVRSLGDARGRPGT